MTLVSATALSQVLAFALSPVLSRVFSPADFGRLANYNAWVSILALVSCLRYEHAIIVAGDTDTTNRVLALTAVLCLGSCAVYALAAVALARLDPDVRYLRSIAGFAPLIPGGVLFACIGSPLTQLTVRLGHFKALGVASVAQIAFALLCQLTLGFLHVPQALILGALAGSLLIALLLARISLDARRVAGVLGTATPHQLRATAAEFVDFPRFTMPSDAIGVLAQQFTPVLILALFDPVLAGVYAFSVRIARAPLIVIGAAINSVLRNRVADYREHDRNLHTLFNRTVRGLIGVGIVPFIIILLFGPQLFRAVFGSQWSDAGRVAQVLSPGTLAEFIALPLTPFFLITRKQSYTLVVQATGFACQLIALVLGQRILGSLVGTCYLISGVMLVTNVSAIALASRATRLAVSRESSSASAAPPQTDGVIAGEAAQEQLL